MLSALRAGRPFPQEDSWYSFLLGGSVDHRVIVRLEGLGQLKKIKSSNIIGIRTRDLQACSIVSQPNNATAYHLISCTELQFIQTNFVLLAQCCNTLHSCPVVTRFESQSDVENPDLGIYSFSSLFVVTITRYTQTKYVSAI
jgi:hypothetical protein